MANFPNSRKVLDSFAKEKVRDMQDRLKNFQKNDTNTLTKSISYQIVETKKGIRVDFYMEDYGKYVEGGRKPFLAWPAAKLVSKKIKDSRRKLAKEGNPQGLQPFPFIDQAFSNTQLIKFDKIFQEAMAKDLEEFVFEGL